MFKNRKALILIILNILIWGFFVYRFYSAYTDYDAIKSEPKSITNKEIFLKDSVDYKLNLGYKDPFLKGDIKNSATPGTNIKSTPKVPKPEIVKTPTIQTKVAQEIKYLGLIKNSNSGVATALVSVGGQSKFVKVNDVMEGITIKKFDNTQLEGMMGKEKIVIKK